MTIAFVQANNSGGAGTASTTRSVTITAIGNNGFIVGIVTWGSATTTDLTSISDNAVGNPNASKYVIIDRTVDATNGQCAALVYGWNLTGNPTVFTANFGTSLAYTGFSIQEHSGVDTASDPLDGTNHQSQVVGTPGTGTDGLKSGVGTQTPSGANYVVIGAAVNSGAVNLANASEFTAGTNFTEPANAEHQVSNDISFSSEYWIQTTATAVNAAWTVAQNTAHIAFQAIFRVASAGGGGNTLMGQACL